MFINPKIVFKDNCKSEDECKFFCTFCQLAHSTFEDLEIAKKWNGACEECYLTFIESRRREWKDGWRPDKETLEEYIYKRHNIILGQEKK